MKGILVGTRIGSLLLHNRDVRQLRKISATNPEQAASAANQIIAMSLISGVCEPDRDFLDIGAHIGSVFSSVHIHDRSISIVAIEAEPEKAEKLRQRFPYCEVIATAVADKEGTATFYINVEASGYNSLAPGRGSREITVPVTTLDSLFPERSFDLIKIDVEGAELPALIGGKDLLRRSRPTIMFESVGAEVNALGHSAEDLWNYLKSLDYEIFAPSHVAHDVPAMSRETFVLANHYPFMAYNYFAIAKERRIEIRDKARRILGIIMPAS